MTPQTEQPACNEISDEALMQRYVKGEQAAFRTLFDRYAPRLQRLFRGSAIDLDAARDLTQQTFLQLHRARNDYRHGAVLRPWVVTIANNLKRDFLRSKGRWRESSFEDQGGLEAQRGAAPAGQSTRLEQRDDQRQVRDALAKLPNSQREVIELHWFGELSFGEIARSLGIGKSAAKVRAHRGYEKLRVLLEQVRAEEGALRAR